MSAERPHGQSIREGTLVTASAVNAANILRDLREHVTNTLGGRMRRYETLLDETIERALDRLAEKAAAQGYDGVMAVRISHPSVVEGGAEVVAYGTGYYIRGEGAAEAAPAVGD